jgi:hypothetical protein
MGNQDSPPPPPPEKEDGGRNSTPLNPGDKNPTASCNPDHDTCGTRYTPATTGGSTLAAPPPSAGASRSLPGDNTFSSSAGDAREFENPRQGTVRLTLIMIKVNLTVPFVPRRQERISPRRGSNKTPCGCISLDGPGLFVKNGTHRGLMMGAASIKIAQRVTHEKY